MADPAQVPGLWKWPCLLHNKLSLLKGALEFGRLEHTITSWWEKGLETPEFDQQTWMVISPERPFLSSILLPSQRRFLKVFKSWYGPWLPQCLTARFPGDRDCKQMNGHFLSSNDWMSSHDGVVTTRERWQPRERGPQEPFLAGDKCYSPWRRLTVGMC